MSKYIPLKHDQYAIVDDTDHEYLSRFKWYYHRYVYRPARDGIVGRTVAIHREIMKPSPGYSVDHINGDPLDNRRCNLRICTQSQNSANSKIRKNKISKFKGVVRLKDCENNPWMARIRCQGQDVYLGCFPTQEDAARAYDAKAKELFGEFAKLNFIQNDL